LKVGRLTGWKVGKRRRKGGRAKRGFRDEAGSKIGRGSGLEAKVHMGWYHVSDNLSRYFLYSNDSNLLGIECNLLRGMGMHGNLVRENDACGRTG
jgi:hypothetical protein